MVTPPLSLTNETDEPFKPVVLHSGYDKLEFAAMGALSQVHLDELEALKLSAKDSDRDMAGTVGNLKCLVRGYGTNATRGYSYIFSTGAIGIQYLAKRNIDKAQWNLHVSVSAQLLATDGIKAAIEQVHSDFDAMGAVIVKVSLSRVDYCVDVQMDKDGTKPSDGFALKLENFIAPAQLSRSVEYSKESPSSFDLRVNSRKRIETITLGKNPGRQVQTYDKRRQAIIKHLYHYFEFWGKDRKTCPTIWRVELRFFKQHLQDFGVRTFEDLFNSIGDVAEDAMQSIRYVENPHVSNVTRAKNHILWDTVHKCVTDGMKENMSGVTRGQLLGVVRKDKIREAEAAIAGRLAGLAYLAGYEPHELAYVLSELAADIAKQAIDSNLERLQKSYTKTAEKLYFLDEEKEKTDNA